MIHFPSFEALCKDSLYKEWKKHHPTAFLSHFFSTLTTSMELTDPWEIGYYDASSEKITVFKSLADLKYAGDSNTSFEVKPEEEVFKKPGDIIHKLELEKVDFSFDQAKELWKKNLPALFPHEISGDGFVILQTLNTKTIWNISCISQTVKFLNMHIDAATGEINSHQTIKMVDKSN